MNTDALLGSILRDPTSSLKLSTLAALGTTVCEMYKDGKELSSIGGFVIHTIQTDSRFKYYKRDKIN